MKTLAKTFFQGLLIFVPAVGSVYLVGLVLVTLDGLLPIPYPGVGLAITLLTITLLGALGSNVIGKRALGAVERGMRRLPVVSLLYNSIKDLLGAFVGDRKTFDKPAMIRLGGPDGAKVFGFVTCRRFDDVRLRGHVAVYLPQAYNFAGNTILVREDQVEEVDADPAQFMAFIVSGGVAEMSAAATVYDGSEAVELVRSKGGARRR